MAAGPSLRAVKVVGFDHVVVNTLNAEAMLAFYCDELGLEPVRVDEWRRGEVLFPSVRVHARDAHRPVPGRADRREHEPLLPGDRADRSRRARRRASRARDRADGLFGAQGFASSVYVHDPDGNTVELRFYEE